MRRSQLRRVKQLHPSGPVRWERRLQEQRTVQLRALQMQRNDCLLHLVHRFNSMQRHQSVHLQFVRPGRKRTRLHLGFSVHIRQLRRQLLLQFGMLRLVPILQCAGVAGYLHDRSLRRTARDREIVLRNWDHLRRQVRRHERIRVRLSRKYRSM